GVEGQLCTIARRDHDAGVLPGQVAHEADLDRRRSAAAPAPAGVVVVLAPAAGEHEGRRGRDDRETLESATHQYLHWDRFVLPRASAEPCPRCARNIAHRGHAAALASES